MLDRFAYKSIVSPGSDLKEGFTVFKRSTSKREISIEGANFVKENLETSNSNLKDYMLSNGFNEGFTKQIISGLTRDKAAKTKPKLMGVINATPDSFYPGSRSLGDLKFVNEMIAQKPDIIDVGGESTRPGASAVAVQLEIERVSQIVRHIASTTKIPVSIDTRNPETARVMIDLGASYINDITGFTNDIMRKVASESGAKCIVMHMRGTPENMNSFVRYDDIVPEMIGFFYCRLLELQASGVKPVNIILDPGIGFAKDFHSNLTILKSIDSFKIGFPLLVGTSRKSWIGHLTGQPVEDRLPGTIASAIFLYLHGVDILRVHDVRENRSALEVFDSLEKVI